MNKKYVYLFSEGDGNMRELLGGKGANLAEMTSLGLPIPQGFTVTTEACTLYYDDGEQINDSIKDEILKAVDQLQTISGKKFGDTEAPLLVSVRSGARVSMPGMMDTVLNLGINDEVAATLAQITDNPRFVYDSYRRFIQMFSDVALGLPKNSFEHELTTLKNNKGVQFDSDLDAEDMKYLVSRFKEIYFGLTNKEFPSDPHEQLFVAIKAVFSSWNTQRAVFYRRMNGIPSSWGTAVNVQEMVFGNMGDDSGTGVAFSRDPATGENKLYGEFLMNAQGEDVVAGIRTPMSIESLKEVNTSVFDEFVAVSDKLEHHFKDIQDMEFTIENGRLYMLQTRNGKRTAQAALKIAVDMVDEGLLTKEEALLKIEPKQLDSLLHARFEDTSLKNANLVGKGLAASPGAACGRIVFTAEKAVEEVKNGPVLLVRNETSPEDIEGMAVVQGILTATGGRTSHAAVVARGMGVCCVAGCSEIHVNPEQGYITIGEDLKVNEGEYMSIDGNTGNVYLGQIEMIEATISGDFAKVMSWADEVRTMGIRANADTPKDAQVAIDFGAEGIGLTRTEHMFFQAERILAIRQMILSQKMEQRQVALDKLLDMQRGDFEGIYRVMHEKPVTVRLLDPPLHEFLPNEEDDIKTLAAEMDVEVDALSEVVEGLREVNPMMGHRGCRLSVTNPEITKMQARAIIEAAINVNKELGLSIVPEIMIPLVCEAPELQYVRQIVTETADEIIAQSGVTLKYKVGTMIETPRAAVVADEIAKHADFFSFGTNDLTQMTFGFSRDDAGKFIPTYQSKNVLERDPFEQLDVEGVGKLVKSACEAARKTNPKISLGICGEHGGDPYSIEFVNTIDLNYVSCSPYRVPIARLAVAQAAIKQK